MLIRTALVVAPESARRRIEALLDSRDLAVVADSPPTDGGAPEDVDLVFVNAEGVGGGLEEWIDRARQEPDPPDVVCLTTEEDASRRASLLARGCLAVLNTRLPDRELRRALRAVARRGADEARSRRAAARLRLDEGRDDLVVVSPGMRETVALCRRIATADSSVLLQGETGVGKERLARAIHAWSGRRGGPFVAVNCGAIPEGLLESELFGHERGAFTGATQARRGHFELAHGGTLFLDEIGELPLALQVKLLRALDERRIQRLGAERTTPVDLRVIAATNRVLDQEVSEGRFRPDLYYRLAVITIALPPLRSRPGDVRALAEHFAAHFGRTLGRPAGPVEPEAWAALEAYAWPGNVRELMNVIERAVLLSPDGRIRVRDLPGPVVASAGAVASARGGLVGAPIPWDAPLPSARKAAARVFEREYLERLLGATAGRVGEAARRAGVNPRTFYDLVRRHGLRKEDYKAPEGGGGAASARNRV